jgi:hypothetical protein
MENSRFQSTLGTNRKANDPAKFDKMKETMLTSPDLLSSIKIPYPVDPIVAIITKLNWQGLYPSGIPEPTSL